MYHEAISKYSKRQVSKKGFQSSKIFAVLLMSCGSNGNVKLRHWVKHLCLAIHLATHCLIVARFITSIGGPFMQI